MDISAKTLGYLFRSYSMAFQGGLKSGQDASEFLRFTLEVPSSGESNTYAWLGQFPKFREWVGERVVKKLSADSYRVTNKTFESTISVLRTQIEDDQDGLFTPMFSEMGISAAEFPGDLVYDLMKLGTTELCFDGKPFFATDHPVGKEGEEVAVSNYGGGAGELWVLMDTSRAIKPFIFQNRIAPNFPNMNTGESVEMRDEYLYGGRARGNAGFGLWQLAFGSKATLDATNFDNAMEALMSFKNDEGSDLKIRPDLLLCTPGNRAAAHAILKAQNLANGETNTNYQVVDLLVTNQLT